MSEEIYDAVAAQKKRTKNPLVVKNTVKHFTKWKQEAIGMMLENDTLMKLLFYDTEDWHLKPKLTDQEKYSMVNKQITQFKIIPEIIETQRSYIGMEMNHFKPQEGFRQFSKDFMQGYFYFNILVDRNIVLTDLGCRNDLILEQLYEMFQSARVFGMGQANCETILSISADSNSHIGYTIGFLISDMK